MKDIELVVKMPQFIYEQILKRHISKKTIAHIFSNGTTRQMTGRWIAMSRTLPLSDAVKYCVRCSNCGTHWDYATSYCPHCGAKMTENEGS